MLLKRTLSTLFVILPFLMTSNPAATFAQNSSMQVPKEVVGIAGTFTGSWTSFGIDEKGQIVKRAAWTDTVKAESPRVKDGRAYVTTTDDMIFEGGRIPPMKVSGTEGYFLK